MTSPALPPQLELSVVVTHLMKGVVYQDTPEKVWRQPLPLQAQIGTTYPCWG